jgi:hypothetical protein
MNSATVSVSVSTGCGAFTNGVRPSSTAVFTSAMNFGYSCCGGREIRTRAG